MTVRIEHGDMREVLARLITEGVTVQSIVTDPPYHLTTGKKGGTGAASLNVNSPAGRSRISTGFMGKAWDGGDIAFQPETWRLCYDLLPPGGHLLAFSGTRTYHRMTCAIDDAGFEIRDMVAWLYGSGFPKSLSVAKSIDKAAGREIDIVPNGPPVKRMIPGADQAHQGWEKNNGREYQPGEYLPSAQAAAWNGWGTALKPALEPICLARKPLIGTVAANVLEHRCGALHIDACRIEGESTKRVKAGGRGQFPHEDDAWMPKTVTAGSDIGRWPANVVHDGSEEVLAAFPEGQSSGGHIKDRGVQRNVYGQFNERTFQGISDSGSAARFFYSSKADAADRLQSKHPTVKPVDLMRWLVRLITPPGGTVLDPFAGSGTTGMACMAEGFNCTLIEREAEYVADIRRRIAHVQGEDTPLFGRAAK